MTTLPPLEELERIGNAATPGPWNFNFGCIIDQSLDNAIILECDLLNDPTRSNTLGFICTARNHWAALIQELRETKALLADSMGECGQALAKTCKMCRRPFAVFSVESHLYCPTCRRDKQIESLEGELRKLREEVEQLMACARDVPKPPDRIVVVATAEMEDRVREALKQAQL